MAIQLRANAVTDVGRVRKENEDAHLVDETLGFYGVADGLGGHADGALAARMALSVTRDELAKRAADLARLGGGAADGRDEAAKIVAGAIQEACKRIHDAGTNTEGRKRGMRSTITCMLRIGPVGIVGHVGDSRLYLMRGGQSHRLTEDHTLAAWHVRSGIIRADEEKDSPYVNTLTRALGSHESVQVDTLVTEIDDGDRFIFCSDGLHRAADDGEIRARVSGDVGRTAQDLVALANQRGANDNVTVLAVACASEDPPAKHSVIDVRITAVAGTPLFSHLDYRERVAILAIAGSRQVPQGTVLVKEGSMASDLYIILSGKVSVERGRRMLTELGAGSHFGEMALVDESPRSATVIALEPVELLVIKREAMMGLMRRDPLLAVKVLWNLAQSLSSRLRATNDDQMESLEDAPRDTVLTPFRYEPPQAT